MSEPAEAGIDALAALLRDEVAAIRRGDLDRVGALAGRKAELAEALAAAEPALRALLDAGGDPALRDRLARLRELVETDRALLARMAEATGAIAAEIARIRDRHGLRGLYGATGAQRGPEPVPAQRLDRSV